MQIANIRGRQIFDSRGNPTVEAEVLLTNNIIGQASVPAGASMGASEACELRDVNLAQYLGRGVSAAVAHINIDINKALNGYSVENQEELDNALCAIDGTTNKSRLGANALLAVSLAAARAYANASAKPLYMALSHGEKMCMPVPMMNVINGGVHADNNLEIQEFMLMPVGAPDFSTAMRMGMEIFHTIKSILRKQGLNTNVGDEGGFAPQLKSIRHALDIMLTAVELAGFKLKDDICFALDVAASELFHENIYKLSTEGKKLSAENLISFYEELVANYPIISIEDGLAENDWPGWHELTKRLGHKIQLVGDDLFVTNSKLLLHGIENQVANAILIKCNQIGTLTETRQAMQIAREHNYNCIISHRSGETEDTFIADLAVATGCGQIKTGSLCRTDRVAKYNQLLRIAEQTSLSYAAPFR